MRAIFILSFLLLVSCTSVDKDLVKAISFGEIDELNEYSPQIDKQLYLRLYRSPIYKKNCFKETEGICQYQYFLSVSTFDEYPETNIFPLSILGEVRQIKWLKSLEIDSVKIELEVFNYTEEAINNNPNLVVEKSVLIVTVSPDKLNEYLVK